MGDVTRPAYPVYVPSRNRHEPNRALTVRALARDQVPFRLVVEPSQADRYRRWISERDQLLILPRDNFGEGSSLPARNWIRDHAIADGHARHWQLDDNIAEFYRLWEGRRIPAHGGTALRVAEILTDRFENVAVSGLNYDMFVNRTTPTPFYRNVHVYSCTLVSHEWGGRWRLRYNEDTDLCLQALTGGWATLLVNAFVAKKVTTMTMGGGNTDGLYREGNGNAAGSDTRGRFEMARVLERAWPGIVTVKRRYGRFQHAVNWPAFADVPLRLRPDANLDALEPWDELGLYLTRCREETKSPAIEALRRNYIPTLAQIGEADPLWRGLPAFRGMPEPTKLALEFKSPEDRDKLVSRLGVTVDKRFEDKAWSAWYPPRSREDPASLRFTPLG